MIIKSERYFLIPFCIIFFIAIVFLLYNGKVETHLLLNQYHTPTLDIFFKYFTEIGGWGPFVVVGVLLLFKWRISAVILMGQLVTPLITTPLKRIIQAPRPSIIFNELNINLPIVEGVKLHSTLSFPSGHTAAAFAFCFALSFFSPKWWQKLLWLAIAILGGYSRIYLSQHFLEDVLAGAIIGIISAYIGYTIFNKMNNKSVQTTNNQ